MTNTDVGRGNRPSPTPQVVLESPLEVGDCPAASARSAFVISRGVFRDQFPENPGLRRRDEGIHPLLEGLRGRWNLGSAGGRLGSATARGWFLNSRHERVSTMTNSNSGISPGSQRQMEIYKGGLAGQTPRQPISVEELERKAKSQLKPEAFDFLAGGAGRKRPCGRTAKPSGAGGSCHGSSATWPDATSAWTSSGRGCQPPDAGPHRGPIHLPQGGGAGRGAAAPRSGSRSS